MTEHNHRRGTREGRSFRYGSRGSWGSLPRGEGHLLQRFAHHKRRGLVQRLIVSGRVDDIPNNTPKHIRWDYW